MSNCIIADERWPLVLWLADENRWVMPPCRPLPAGASTTNDSTDAASNRGQELDASCFYRGRCDRPPSRNASCKCLAGYHGPRCDQWQRPALTLPVQQWLIGSSDAKLEDLRDKKSVQRSSLELRVYDTVSGTLTLANGRPTPVCTDWLCASICKPIEPRPYCAAVCLWRFRGRRTDQQKRCSSFRKGSCRLDFQQRCGVSRLDSPLPIHSRC